MKKILLIGGTGIIGLPLMQTALTNGYDVTAISHNISMDEEGFHIMTLSREHENWSAAIDLLADMYGPWDTVVDIYNFNKTHAEQTYKTFRSRTNKFIVVSSGIVYDRLQQPANPLDSINEQHPLAKIGDNGSYADGKIEVERYWQSVSDVPWTVIRPWHIVGENAYLGCISGHNRDPNLLERLKSRHPLNLANGGRQMLTLVDNLDLADQILRLSDTDQGNHQAFNVDGITVNALDYYQAIASYYSQKFEVNDLHLAKHWDSFGGWALTNLNNVFDGSKLTNLIKYNPRTTLENAIEAGLLTYNSTNDHITDAVHKRMASTYTPKKPEWVK